MLAGFASSIAADAGAEPDALRFVFTNASQVKDERTLEYLARNPSIPDDVAEALDASPIARVMVARLSRPGASADKLQAAARDKRMGVGVAVASAVGLPDEVYETLVSANRHPKVMSAVIANVSAPTSARLAAASTIAFTNTTAWGGSYRSRYELRARLAEFMDEYPAFAAMILDRAGASLASLDEGLVAKAVAAAGITEQQLRAVGAQITATLSSPEYQRTRRYAYRDSSVSEIAKSLASLNDVPAETLDQIDAAYVALGQESLWELRNFQSARSQARTRPAMPFGLVETDDSLAVPEKELRALLGQALSIQDRVRVARSYDLTDEQFARVLMDRASGWSFSAEYADSTRFRSDVLALTRECAHSPVRLAALILKMPWTFLDKETMLAHAPEVAAALATLKSNEKLSFGPRDEWLRMVLAYGLDEQMASSVEVSLALKQSLYVTGADGPELSASWSAAVSRYLWSRFKDEPAAWDVFAKVSGSLPISLSEAASAALDTLV